MTGNTITIELTAELAALLASQGLLAVTQAPAAPEVKPVATLADLTVDEALILLSYADSVNPDAGKKGKQSWLTADRRAGAYAALAEHFMPEGSGASLKEAAQEVQASLEARGLKLSLNDQGILPLFGQRPIHGKH